MNLAVIIPTFDRPVGLREALLSIHRQTRLPDEVHVVFDAGPRLDALEREFASVLPMYWHHLSPNVGQAAARNYALARTEAEAVAFLDDDDLFLEKHLERLERALRQTPGTALVFDDTELWLANVGEKPPPPERRRRIALDYDEARMRSWDTIPPCNWLVRSEVLQRAGGFDATLRCYEDWDVLLRLESWGGARRVPGLGAVVRIAAVSHEARGETANQSLRFDDWRLEMLARFQAKHDLTGIQPMTFWDVAAVVATESA